MCICDLEVCLVWAHNLESTALDSIAVCFRVRQGQTQEAPPLHKSECCCQVDIEIVGDIERLSALIPNRFVSAR